MGASPVTSAQMIAALPISAPSGAPLVGAPTIGEPLPRLSITGNAETRGPTLPPPGAPTTAMRSVNPCKRTAPSMIDWSYDGEGAPEHWGRLRAEFAACSIGERQSPVALDAAIPITTRRLDLQYRPSRFEVIDDGRNLVVGVRGASSLRFEGLRLRLDQVRFHRPGEHWIKGVRPDMSAHLIHESPSGITLVIAVPLMRGPDANPALQQILNAIPLEPGGAGRGTERLDLAGLLPASHARYVYQGSLSTPPCTEGVHWMVLQQPVMISDAQYDVFARLFTPNARPIQALNGRRVKGTM
ncbi:MAG: carbonic anhydrase family protein [Burkholderiaceae bacterium]